VEALLARRDLLPNKANYDHRTPLHAACQEGHEAIVLLLASDARVRLNQPNNRHQTPLWIACYYGRERVVKALLASSLDIHTRCASAWKNLLSTPAQQAREMKFHQIADLVDRYENNPEEVVIELRKELQIQGFLFLPLLLDLC